MATMPSTPASETETGGPSLPTVSTPGTPGTPGTPPPTVSPGQAKALREEADAYLRSLLNKHLVVHTTDGRMFRGEFKCTDQDRNLVLAHATEYRHPTPRQRQKHAAEQAALGHTSVTVDMETRYLGLIVTPGEYITKIEVEEFSSQLRRPL